MPELDPLDELNRHQRAAVLECLAPVEQERPLLIIAGAGSGKTKTLVHRVAHLIRQGTHPQRILLLTFTRRAASEMSRRARSTLGRSPDRQSLSWAGTFHSVANRLLRLHFDELRLDPAFTVLDRADSADLLDAVRYSIGLSRAKERFPQKGTCLAIYSRTVNSQRSLEECLQEAFPWCAKWSSELRLLFRGYTEAKQERHVLDYDDLLLYWYYLMSEPAPAARVSARFDHVLVDEYQDTNTLQARILRGLAPNGKGLTVVGDDAQAIYSFRGATVRNILDFPQQFPTGAALITLDQNYRSTQPILDAANQVICLAAERFTKDLASTRSGGSLPRLATTADEFLQVDYVVARILEHREAGVPLKQQAVLFRAAHHSDALELELSRRGIPFVKYGGLRFLEAAHIKDVLCFLRWAENPRDSLAAARALQLCPGIGRALASRACQHLAARHFAFESLRDFSVPAAAGSSWVSLCDLLLALRNATTGWPVHMSLVRRWYQPQLERLYDAWRVRLADLDQLEQIAGQYSSRERFLSEMMMEPPELSGAEAGAPLLDEDYLILSTIHSAKGQEWRVVYILNVVDGCIPSDMACGSAEQIEEERRLLYVAMTRARDSLDLIHPLKMFVAHQPRLGDRYLMVPRSRFLPDSLLGCFERVAWAEREPQQGALPTSHFGFDVGQRLRSLWDA